MLEDASTLWAERLVGAVSRAVLISMGTFAAWWGVWTFPIFWHDARLEHLGHKIINGEQFKPEILREALSNADFEKTWPRPELLTRAAIVRFGLAEQTSISDNDNSHGDIRDELDSTVRRSLSVAPSDAFLWLALFVSERMKEDGNEEDLNYLRMSYHLGPHEGWVAVRRNGIAISHFQELPPDLADAAVTEFRDLVVSGYFNTAAKILVGPGWPIHETLLHRILDVPIEARRRLALAASGLGHDIEVPGVERPEPRPWQ